jgi:hypothetical protein
VLLTMRLHHFCQPTFNLTGVPLSKVVAFAAWWRILERKTQF